MLVAWHGNQGQGACFYWVFGCGDGLEGASGRMRADFDRGVASYRVVLPAWFYGGPARPSALEDVACVLSGKRSQTVCMRRIALREAHRRNPITQLFRVLGKIKLSVLHARGARAQSLHRETTPGTPARP